MLNNKFKREVLKEKNLTVEDFADAKNYLIIKYW